jgi:hypothetical protein
MKVKNKFRIFLPFTISIIIVCIYTIWHQLILWKTNGMIAMNDFMWIWFLLFWLLKLLDLRWFVRDFRKYDILAKNIWVYGWLFPFAEIILWIAYILDYKMDYRIAINTATILIVWITSIWILQSLRKKQKTDCVCMWTVFPLPMSNINLIENIAMWAMAVFMIFWMILASHTASTHMNSQSDITNQTANICH